jgi:hypothetical protein
VLLPVSEQNVKNVDDDVHRLELFLHVVVVWDSLQLPFQLCFIL